MTTPLQTFGRQLRGRQLYPFAIGFATVFMGSLYISRLKEDDYKTTTNKRFAAPFVKKDPNAGDQH